MPNDGPMEVIVALIVGAIVVSLLASPLNEVTSVDLMLWSQILWAVAIIGIIAIIYAAVQGITAGGSR